MSSSLTAAAAVVVVDVDNDGEFVPDASICPFLPLTPETVLCIMKWYRYARRFCAPGQPECGHAPYFLTDTFYDFLAHFYVDSGEEGIAGIAINNPLHFTVDSVSYDTVNCRFTEFVQHVYDSSSSDQRVPPTYHCWRDLVMFMAVQALDEVCSGIVHMPDGVKALVCELAKRMNSIKGIRKFSQPAPIDFSEQDSNASMGEEGSQSSDDGDV